MEKSYTTIIITKYYKVMHISLKVFIISDNGSMCL